MKTNRVQNKIVNTTFEGGAAAKLSPKQELEHTTLACLLWEDTFYEDGISIADRIKECVKKCSISEALEVAKKSKFEQKLRHAPLWILAAIIDKIHLEKKSDPDVFNSNEIAKFFTRADDMGELVSMYKLNAGEKAPIPNILKKAVAKALTKFDEYQVAKYASKKVNYRLVDLVNLCHPKPTEALSKLINGNLEAPDTWEVAVSAAGSDQDRKAAAWQRLVVDDIIPDMAFLMNIRNIDNNVPGASEIILERIEKIQSKKLLPITFLRSGLANQRYQVPLEKKFFECFVGDKLSGKTAILVDISGSMGEEELNYANSLAMIAQEKYSDCDIYSFSDRLVKVKNLSGFKLCDEINKSQGHNCTYMWNSIDEACQKANYDRMIVITDEQSHDSQKGKLNTQLYIINVASYDKSVKCDDSVVQITGFSDRVFDYIDQYETK